MEWRRSTNEGIAELHSRLTLSAYKEVIVKETKEVEAEAGDRPYNELSKALDRARGEFMY